jgi:two-component system, OmpR family, alkaline phosphatase synthesis response regulator PhoP
LDGIEICKMIRSAKINTPIIMITSKSEEIDRVIGLETGADDYIIKPFSIREFQARVKAVLRRSISDSSIQENSEKCYIYNNLMIDVEKRICTKNDQRVDLAPKEFELLALLAANPGKSFNRQSILNLVWGYDFEGFQHTVNSHINRIRAKIEDDMANPNFVITSWGYGYRFNEDL